MNYKSACRSPGWRTTFSSLENDVRKVGERRAQGWGTTFPSLENDTHQGLENDVHQACQ
ncbi:MAG: hypothetical protein LBL78_02260 [Prevotellaceae bacterium]|nr:hypothetical protein [Prevotellaceae bacterium]